MILRVLCACVLAAALPAAAQSPAPAKPLAPFGWFADLVGACWKGDHPDGKTSDVQCYDTQYGRLIRGTIKVSMDGKVAFEGDSVFTPGRETNLAYYAQWGANGSFGTGELAIEAETLRFRNRSRDGKEAPMRYVWRRIDSDSYRVTPERQADAGWAPGESVVYRRVR